MHRIVALNESDQEGDFDDEDSLTKEAQETIAESEYMRAIQLKCKGKTEDALSLLNNLLETKVLNEMLVDNKNEKLWAIRYNCHKNVALLYEEKMDFENALENYVLASKFDEGDVYTLNRLGQLALKTSALELADYAFERCLRRNPNHWNAVDGILKLHCCNKNVIGAYGWALQMMLKDPNYIRASDVIFEIRKKFPDSIPFYELIWNKNTVKTNMKENNMKRFIFSHSKLSEDSDENCLIKPMHLNTLKLNALNWISVGKYITTIYNYLTETRSNILFILELNDIYKGDTIAKQNELHLENDENSLSNFELTVQTDTYNSSNHSTGYNILEEICTKIESTEPALNDLSKFVAPVSESEIIRNQQIESANDDSDSNVKSDQNENNKPKSRRRCSDLHFLEQWGWHKNRRYSSRKKNQQDRPEIDTTLKGFLGRIFSKYLKLHFDTSWPIQSTNLDIMLSKDPCTCSNSNISILEFQKNTQNMLNDFLAELTTNQFDMLLLMQKWLKYMSNFWNIALTEDLKTIYRQICLIYMNHFDLSTWNQLSEEAFIESYTICLFYLELEYDEIMRSQSEVSAMWRTVLDHLMYYSGSVYVVNENKYRLNLIRLVNMEYNYTKYIHDFNKSVECLKHLESLFDMEEIGYILHIPNVKKSCLNKEKVHSKRIDIQRKLSLKMVPQLFDEKKWTGVIAVIIENFTHMQNTIDCEYWQRDFKTQIEVLLQSYWNLCELENCLIWAEKCLHYVVSRYISETSDSQRSWAESINYIFTYIESLIFHDGYEILNHLEDNLSRLVQNVIRILSYQLDAPYDKHNNPTHELEIKRTWVVLHQVMLREENNSPVIVKTKSMDTTLDAEEIEDLIPHSFLLLFTAHEFLGKRLWCTRDNGALLLYILDVITPNLRAPLYDSYRDIVYEYLEQVTYCLYGFPPKKARSRHIEDHESSPTEITWPKALQLFDLYRPECLPEFNSYKLESVSADMEQLLLKIVLLMHKEICTKFATTKILQFISGELNELPDDADSVILPFKISCIYYLLADYYFKNRDFSKTLRYYTLDLACNPTRLDSWAGMALSKASKIETKLNDFLPQQLTSFLIECEDTIRCFEQCIKLNRTQTLLWIEYGSFSYTIHSFCSRYLKQTSNKLSTEECIYVEGRKNKLLNIAYNCFSLAASLQNNLLDNDNTEEESHEEKWLCQYMLGKVTEKRKEQPKVYLNYYLTAANYLYESKATYPIKINHSNPTPLSVEALEVFYRTNAAIIKYIEHEKEIDRETGDFFKNVLHNLSNSPFAFNKAKIDGSSLNVLKRKIENSLHEVCIEKKSKVTTEPVTTNVKNKSELQSDLQNKTDKKHDDNPVVENVKNVETSSTDITVISKGSPSRRGSNESTATAESTTTGTRSTSNSSSTNSTDSSSSDSESDFESDTATKKHTENTPYSEDELVNIYISTVQNLEECVTRFPEHYKSIYRLVYHYMNGPKKLQNLDRCEQLLLGQYTTDMGNQVNGIFFDRKNNNIFNGIWRLPSSEIDRPGSFSTHLVKCVAILIQMLTKKNNHKLLIDVGLQLYKTPDNDKRYITDTDRIELYQQSINHCVSILREILNKNTCLRNDNELLNLLIDIYKTHKKCVKYMNQKEPLFTQLLIEVYKFFIQDKVDKVPEHLNFLDLAIKLCLQEIASRKNQEKMLDQNNSCTNLNDALLGISNIPLNSGLLNTVTCKPIQIPGLPLKPRVRTNTNMINPFASDTSNQIDVSLISSMQKPIGSTNMDPTGFQKLVAEYYKILENKQGPFKPNLQMSGASSGHSALSFASSLPTETTITPSSRHYKAANVIQQTSISTKNTSINIGESELTITPSYMKAMPTTSDAMLLPILTNTSPSVSIATTSNNTTDVFSRGIFVKPLVDMQDIPHSVSPAPDMLQSLMSSSLLQATHMLQLSDYQKLQEKKAVDKLKVVSKKKNKPLTPYTRPVSTSPQSAPSLNVLANTSSTLMSHLNMTNVNQQASILAAYADLLKKIPISQQSQLQPFYANAHGQSLPKRKQKINKKSSAELLTMQSLMCSTESVKNQNPVILPKISSTDVATTVNNAVYVTTNQQDSPVTLSAQTQNMLAFQKSPTKTLQQKLAERQRANQQNDSRGATTTEPTLDVIILD